MYGAYVTLLRTPITVAARAYTDKSSRGMGGECEKEKDLKIGALAQVMALNCNSFRFALRCQPIYLAFALPCYFHILSAALSLTCTLSLSLSLFVQRSHRRVCCVECASVLCNLLVLCPLICVVYLTQMPHKNNKQSNNNRKSFMHMQSPHTCTHRRTAALCINVRGAATYAGVAWCINLALKCMQHIYICTLHNPPPPLPLNTETMPGSARSW